MSSRSLKDLPGKRPLIIKAATQLRMAARVLVIQLPKADKLEQKAFKQQAADMFATADQLELKFLGAVEMPEREFTTLDKAMKSLPNGIQGHTMVDTRMKDTGQS